MPMRMTIHYNPIPPRSRARCYADSPRRGEYGSLGRRLRGAANNEMSDNKHKLIYRFNSGFPSWQTVGFNPCETPKMYVHEQP